MDVMQVDTASLEMLFDAFVASCPSPATAPKNFAFNTFELHNWLFTTLLVGHCNSTCCDRDHSTAIDHDEDFNLGRLRLAKKVFLSASALFRDGAVCDVYDGRHIIAINNKFAVLMKLLLLGGSAPDVCDWHSGSHDTSSFEYAHAYAYGAITDGVPAGAITDDPPEVTDDNPATTSTSRWKRFYCQAAPHITCTFYVNMEPDSFAAGHLKQRADIIREHLCDRVDVEDYEPSDSFPSHSPLKRLKQ